MMIMGIGPPVTHGRTIAAGVASQGRGRFSVGRQAAADAPTGPGATADVSLSGLLSLQEDPHRPDDDDRPRRHAGLVLDELSALQRALLASDDTGPIAEKLCRLLRDLPPTADPALATAIRMVTLRARIETARIEMAHVTVRQPDP